MAHAPSSCCDVDCEVVVVLAAAFALLCSLSIAALLLSAAGTCWRWPKSGAPKLLAVPLVDFCLPGHDVGFGGSDGDLTTAGSASM